MNIFRTGNALAACLALAASLAASAADVSADDARVAVGAWMGEGGGGLNGSVASVETVVTNGASMHVVNLEGGGFVVTPVDDRIQPVVAYSDSGSLARDGRNPLWVLLKADLEYRAKVIAAIDAAETNSAPKLLSAAPSTSAATTGGTADGGIAEVKSARSRWAKLLSSRKSGLLKASSGVSSISDVRVSPLTSTTWNQGDVGGSPCYNYYTPSNYVCGCVATATAQIMKYFRYPAGAVEAVSMNCAVDGVERTFSMYGGTYDWDSMPESPSSAISEYSRKAIGKLTYDIGVSVGMDWAADRSSSALYFAGYQMIHVFGYAGTLCDWFVNGRSYSLAAAKAAVIPNCDSGLPVMMSIPGHAVYVDGYGYEDGEFYLHMNPGWGGQDTAWYLPPNFTTTSYIFNGIEGFVCNISTNRNETYTAVSGRVLSSSGTPVESAVVTATVNNAVVATDVTDANGIYGFLVPAGTCVLSAAYGTESVRTSVAVEECVGLGQTGDGWYLDGQGYASMNNNLYDLDLTLSDIASVDSPVFSPAGGTYNEPVDVSITCPTEGATIRYTTDGSDPAVDSTVYSAPITIKDGCTVKARAYKDGMSPSLITSAAYVISGLAAALDTPGLVWTTTSDWTWEAETTNTHDGVDAVLVQDYADAKSYYPRVAELSASIAGPATVSFWYATRKARATFFVMIDGEKEYSECNKLSNQEWTQVSFNLDSGVHSLVIGFSDLAGGYYGNWTIDGIPVPNLAVVDQVVVTYAGGPSATTNEVAVPFTWLDEYYSGAASDLGGYSALAETDSDGDGYSAWAEYLAGTDPTNSESRFYATISMVDGSPVVGWCPTNAIDGVTNNYVIEGSSTLSTNPADWVSPPDASARFFRVRATPGAGE